MGQSLPTPPPSPKKNLPPVAKAGQHALDKDEIVGEVGGSGYGHGVNLREDREMRRGYPGGAKRHNEMVDRMVNDQDIGSSARDINNPSRVPLSKRSMNKGGRR